MNRQVKRSLEPSSIPKRTYKQQVLCDGELSITDSSQNTLEVLGLNRDLMEVEADCFAGELLIPEKACYELAKRFQGRFGKKLDVLVGRLVPEFLVSKQAMKRRLIDLNIVEKLPKILV